MLDSFFNCVLEIFSGIISVLRYTDLGGVTLETVLVVSLILTVVARTVIVKFGE